jgi:hypothetical protein
VSVSQSWPDRVDLPPSTIAQDSGTQSKALESLHDSVRSEEWLSAAVRLRALVGPCYDKDTLMLEMKQDMTVTVYISPPSGTGSFMGRSTSLHPCLNML